jgi:hypothetical protein
MLLEAMHHGKSKPQDTSALFSLQELMRLEAERELDERRKQDEQLQADQRAREAEEQRQREHEQQRLTQEQERRALDAQREREEHARHGAIREAERERARIEAENAGRLEALRAQQQHEQALAALGRDRSKRRAKWLAVLSMSLLLLVAIGGGLFLRAQMHKTEELEGRIAGLQSEIDSKQRSLSTTTSPEERKRLEDELDALRNQVGALQTGKTPPPKQVTPPPNNAGTRSGAKKDDVCEQIRSNPNDPRRFDPANGCL